MPTVWLFNGLRVTIYTNEHRPPHVHVIGRGCEAVFLLNCPDGPVELDENFGFSKREVRQILRALAERLADLCRGWRRIHEL